MSRETSCSRSGIDKNERPCSVALRKSCHFCRSRKIRCSGHTNGTCSACRQKGIDCIFNPESAKGRPRRSLSSTTVNHTPTLKPFDDQLDALSLPPQTSLDCIGEDLTSLYSDDICSDQSGHADPWKRSMARLRARIEQNHRIAAESGSLDFEQNMPSDSIYDGSLGHVAQQLVRLMAMQHGRLGIDGSESEAKFFSLFTGGNEALSPLNSNMNLSNRFNPMDRLPEQLRLQLVEMWFNAHPLCMIISKTLFLRSYKDNRYDSELLAVVMAGALHFYDNDQSPNMESQLFEHAEAQLNERSSGSWDLQTAQIILLIGWHELCLKKSPRAIYLIAYAGRMAAHLQQALEDDQRIPKGLANGVDIDAVEAELMSNVYWIAFAITLWAFMEVGESFGDLLPKTDLPNFPVVDESQSTILKLDKASDNVSSFQHQARAIRGLWPLAHIACTIGHLTVLHSHRQDPRPPPSQNPWQLAPIQQLRSLMRLNNTVESVSQNVRRILQDAINAVQSEVRNDISKALVTAANLALIIHLDFPKMSDPNEGQKCTADLLGRLQQSTVTLTQIIHRITQSQTSQWLLATSSMSASTATPLVEIFSTGLDVVGRAMLHILDRLNIGDHSERQVILGGLANLGALVDTLYLDAKQSPLNSSRRAHVAKKMLKQVRKRIEEIGGYGNHPIKKLQLQHSRSFPGGSPKSESVCSTQTSNVDACDDWSRPGRHSISGHGPPAAMTPPVDKLSDLKLGQHISLHDQQGPHVQAAFAQYGSGSTVGAAMQVVADDSWSVSAEFASVGSDLDLPFGADATAILDGQQCWSDVQQLSSHVWHDTLSEMMVEPMPMDMPTTLSAAAFPTPTSSGPAQSVDAGGNVMTESMLWELFDADFPVPLK